MFKLKIENEVVSEDAIMPKPIIQNLNRRSNLFITGPAGTGKTYLVDQLVKHSELPIVITASTGVAAMNVGGITIHSWSGINIHSHPSMIKKITTGHRWNYVANRIREAKFLVIDEIGMLKAGQLDLINDICRYAFLGDKYASGPPFGGLQVMLTGDFFQIPPVFAHGQEQSNYAWAFESKVWREGSFHTFALSKMHRQKDAEFAKVLNNIRYGILDGDGLRMLQSRVNATLPAGAVPMRFVGTNEKVKAGNKHELEKAHGQLHTFKSLIVVHPNFKTWEASVKAECVKQSKMEDFLELKEGMPIVMLVNRNTTTEYFMNGSIGTFLGMNAIGHPIVKMQKTGATFAVSKHTDELKNGDGTVKASFNQFPLRLAHYSTFHKAQGLTLDYIEVDMRNMFNPGMAYTGLSRVTSLEGLVIKNFNPRSIKASRKVLKFYGKLA